MTIETVNEELSAFYEKHLTLPGAVIVVYAQFRVGIFNSLERAIEWADKIDDPVAFMACMINQPEFGEIQSRRLH